MKTGVKVDRFKASGKFYDSVYFETETGVFDIPQIKKEAMEGRNFLRGVNFTIEVTSLDGEDLWNKYMYVNDHLLTVEKLKAMKPHTIIAAGETENSPEGIYMTEERNGDSMLWVAKRGEMHDWAIYVGWKEWGFDKVLMCGEKVIDMENIKRLVPCDDEASKVYRR